MKRPEKRKGKQAKQERAPHMNESTEYIRECQKSKKQTKITQKTKYLNKGSENTKYDGTDIDSGKSAKVTLKYRKDNTMLEYSKNGR